jgi:hypothetical protein
MANKHSNQQNQQQQQQHLFGNFISNSNSNINTAGTI